MRAVVLVLMLARCDSPVGESKRALCCEPYDAGGMHGCRPTMVDRELFVPRAFVDDSAICAEEGWLAR